MDGLIPGKKYRVALSDCCVVLEFVATFVRYDDPDYTMCDLIFDTVTIERAYEHAVVSVEVVE